MVSSVQFMRKTDVIIGTRLFPMDDFEMSFEIGFDDDTEPNTGHVKIINLSESTISQISKGSQIIVNAGYAGDVGSIFVGSIDKVKSEWSGVDKISQFDVGDATDRWINTYVNKSYKSGITASQIVKDVLGSFGIEIGVVALAEDKVYPGGKIVTGQLQSVLKSIVVNDCKSKFHIINGVIMISAPAAGTQTGFLLNADTGLIDSPMKVDDEKEKVDYKVKCLLNHRLTTDSLIQIQSKTANGNFRVVRGKHIGSNSGDFITETEVKAI
ncbi:phage protein [Anaerosolibacter sp.]|uniref:phage protein n=1 Tax=Anaerosolibacter sp. TaxID=1872527 RepID=UPI0039F0D27E